LADVTVADTPDGTYHSAAPYGAASSGSKPRPADRGRTASFQGAARAFWQPQGRADTQRMEHPAAKRMHPPRTLSDLSGARKLRYRLLQRATERRVAALHARAADYRGSRHFLAGRRQFGAGRLQSASFFRRPASLWEKISRSLSYLSFSRTKWGPSEPWDARGTAPAI